MENSKIPSLEEMWSRIQWRMPFPRIRPDGMNSVKKIDREVGCGEPDVIALTFCLVKYEARPSVDS